MIRQVWLKNWQMSEGIYDMEPITENLTLCLHDQIVLKINKWINAIKPAEFESQTGVKSQLQPCSNACGQEIL